MNAVTFEDKHTTLSAIPDDWSIKRLGDLGQVKMGLTYKPENVSEFGTLVLRSSNIQKDRLTFENNVFVDIRVRDSASVQTGDLLICVRNGSRRLIGKTAMIDKRANGMAFGAFMSAFRSELNFYLIWLFQSQIIQKQIEENLGATINQITNSTLKRFQIPLPNNPKEQEAIAEALSDADALIEGLERLIAKKRLIKQGAMQELLTERRRLPGFSGEWVDYTIQDIANVDPEALGAGTSTGRIINYISLEDVSRGALNGWSETSFRDAPSRARRVLRQYDVLLGTVRPNLQSHLLFDQKGDNWIGSTGFAVLRARPEFCSPRYLFELVMSHVIGRQIDELIAGSNYPAISNREVRTLQISLPPLNEQNAISTILSDMDAEIQILETRLGKSRQVKEGMMQNLLTGRIKLV